MFLSPPLWVGVLVSLCGWRSQLHQHPGCVTGGGLVYCFYFPVFDPPLRGFEVKPKKGSVGSSCSCTSDHHTHTQPRITVNTVIIQYNSLQAGGQQVERKAHRALQARVRFHTEACSACQHPLPLSPAVCTNTHT